MSKHLIIALPDDPVKQHSIPLTLEAQGIKFQVIDPTGRPPALRLFSAVCSRVETGPIQFGDDWPGVFIRGDHALLGFLPALARMLARSDIELGAFDRMELVGLMRTLESCNAHIQGEKQ